MKTFLLYALGIIGFMFLSYVLENGLIEDMYKTMNGEIIPSSSNLVIEDVTGKASNVNGFMSFKLSNDSSSNIENQYIKIDLYSKQGLYAASKYVKINDLPAESTKNYEVKFKGTEIRSYKLSIVSELPDKSNIINILGWEIDLTNVFGMDLTNVTILGVKLTDLFSWENAKVAGSNAWSWTKALLQSIPWWGYAIATGIILWYMPKGYLFGIFPF
jgi:hypothetical protein